MKKMFAALAAGIILLTGCSAKTEEQKTNKTAQSWRLVSFYDMYESDKHGSFVLEQNGMLEFLDFESMEKSPVCNDATCKHEAPKGGQMTATEKDCPAFGKNNHPFLYSGKLYWFRATEFERREDGLLSQGLQLWSGDVGGGNEKQLAEIKGLTIRDYDKALLKDGKLWTLLTDEPIDPNNVMRPSHSELVCFDLENGDYKNYGAVSDDHYSAGFWVYGEWNGKLVFQCSYNKDDRPFMEAVHDYAEKHAMTDNEAMTEYTGIMEYVISYYEADLSTGEVKPLTMPEPMCITEKGYYFTENGRLKCTDQNGRTTDLTEAPEPADVQKLNGWLFYSRGGKYYLMNEKDCKETEIRVGEWAPQWIYNDELIYMQVTDIVDENGMVTDQITQYFKKPIAELTE